MTRDLRRHFQAVLQSGHKQHALEVPFDPALQWQATAIVLRPGRRGYPAHAICGRIEFESAVVARSGRHWLLVDERTCADAGWQVGDALDITIASGATATT